MDHDKSAQITSLTAERDRLRAALEWIAKHPDPVLWGTVVGVARDALATTPPPPR